jgi:hypothetical protein
MEAVRHLGFTGEREPDPDASDEVEPDDAAYEDVWYQILKARADDRSRSPRS